MSAKNFTIKGADSDDIDKFNEIKAEKKQTQAGTFNFLLKAQNTKVNQDENLTAIEELKKQIEELTLVNQGLLTEKDGLLAEKTKVDEELVLLQATVTDLTTTNAAIVAEFEALKAQDPEVKEIELTGDQFICEPTEAVAKMARKVRPFAVKQGKFTGTQDEYPNWLFNKAVPYYLNNKFEEIFE